MFTATSSTNETQTFTSYAEAFRFVQREGGKSRLWDIRASSLEVLAAAKAEKAAFHA